LQEVERAFRAGDYRQVIAQLNQLLQTQPDNVQARKLIHDARQIEIETQAAVVAYQTGDLAMCAQILGELRHLNPHDPTLRALQEQLEQTGLTPSRTGAPDLAPSVAAPLVAQQRSGGSRVGLIVALVATVVVLFAVAGYTTFWLLSDHQGSSASEAVEGSSAPSSETVALKLWSEAEELASRGDAAEALARLDLLLRTTRSGDLRQHAKELQRDLQLRISMREARELAAEGRTQPARKRLERVLERRLKYPGAAALLAQLDETVEEHVAPAPPKPKAEPHDTPPSATAHTTKSSATRRPRRAAPPRRHRSDKRRRARRANQTPEEPKAHDQAAERRFASAAPTSVEMEATPAEDSSPSSASTVATDEAPAAAEPKASTNERASLPKPAVEPPKAHEPAPVPKLSLTNGSETTSTPTEEGGSEPAPLDPAADLDAPPPDAQQAPQAATAGDTTAAGAQGPQTATDPALLTPEQRLLQEMAGGQDGEPSETTGSELTSPTQGVRGTFGEYLSFFGSTVNITGYGSLRLNKFTDDTPLKFDNHYFVMQIGTRISDWIFIETEIEYEHNGREIKAEYAIIDFQLREWFLVRAGLILVPFGLFNETLHPAFRNRIARRPLVYRRIFPATYDDAGVQLRGLFRLGDHRLGYAAYVVNGLRSGSDSDSGSIRDMRGRTLDPTSSHKAFGGRLWTDLQLGTETALHLGASGYTGVHASDPARWLTMVGADLMFNWADLELLSEWVTAWQQREGGAALRKTGVYTQLAYTILDRVQPVVRFDLQLFPGLPPRLRDFLK
jgi:tetratricopeptide (TPR) repeat protein